MSRRRSNQAKPNQPPAPPTMSPASPKRIRWGACLILLAGLAAYANSFSGPFIFDDGDSISNNPTIRSLWPIGRVLVPPSPGYTVEARPILNLSLALNFAAHGLNVRGYHVTNLAIHLLAALTLYGLVRRTLLLPGFPPALTRHAWGLSISIALLWTVHPLQTQAVTYIIQRAESLMGLLYLLTLYCALRGSTSTRPRAWYAGAVSACALGMGVKEVMASAPIIVLCYDRIFLSTSWKESLRKRAGFYVALFSTWVLLVYAQTALRGFRMEEGGFAQGASQTVSLADPTSIGAYLKAKLWADVTCTPWTYLLAQGGVLLRYLRLAFWPDPLILDYYWPFPKVFADVWLSVTLVAALLFATVWALVRYPRAGFLGLCFFLILAPSSSVLPSEDAAFEQRMYLPLAVVLTGGSAAMCLLWPRIAGWFAPTRTRTRHAGYGELTALVAMLTVALMARTLVRNHDYRSELAIWDSTVRNRGNNPRAYHGRGVAYADLGQYELAEADLALLVAMEPANGEAHASLGDLLARQGRVEESSHHFAEAVRLRPHNVTAHMGLGNVLVLQGRMQEAMPHYFEAVRLEPHRADALSNLGVALCAQGRVSEALPYLAESVRLVPDNAKSQNNLGRALLLLGRRADAVEHLQEAVRLKPDYTEARKNLAEAQSGAGHK